MTDVSDLRRDYGHAKLDIGDLLADPIAQFKQWFEDALAAKIVDPNAMTSRLRRQPARPLRTVLLRATGTTGSCSSRPRYKPADCAESARRCCFRGCRAAGDHQRHGRADLDGGGGECATRPRESRIAAWVSPQSKVIDARRMLEAKFEEMLRKFGQGEIPVPSFWGGYRVTPKTIEFWQGGQYRLHDRFLYSRTGSGWTISRLAP
jgi:pyridoxamine 5'-phosphate oxidase